MATNTDAQLEGERCAKKRALADLALKQLTLKREKIALKAEEANLELINVTVQQIKDGVNDDMCDTCAEFEKRYAELMVENAQLKVELAQAMLQLSKTEKTALFKAQAAPTQ